MRMDSFIDLFAQRKNAQEMIKANSQAEAAKLLKALGRAKMGSPGSVIEVWVADGIGGWARA